MANAQTKWWLPSAIAAIGGVVEIAAAYCVGSVIWTIFGFVWIGIAAIYLQRSRP